LDYSDKTMFEYKYYITLNEELMDIPVKCTIRNKVDKILSFNSNNISYDSEFDKLKILYNDIVFQNDDSKRSFQVKWNSSKDLDTLYKLEVDCTYFEYEEEEE